MRTRIILVFILSLPFSMPALANLSGGSRDPEPSRSTPEARTNDLTPREQAARLYRDGHEDVTKAKRELAEGKTKNATKRFKRALDRGQEAVALDTTYHEAWNLVGYSARHLGDYDRSLAAYHRCLRLKPDYAEAREYLGEAYVALGDLPKAREQLAWLERLKATEEAADLKEAIDAWAAAHPDSTAPKAAATDSTAAPQGGGSER
jgi:tetratricopeptide (TPR) repeat protein